MEKRKKIKVMVSLEKLGKKTGKRAFIALSKEIMKSSRRKTVTNLSSIDSMAKKTAGEKTLVVAGKVLGTGVLSQKAIVVALEFSEKARKKISEAGGKAVTLEDFSKSPQKAGQLVIMK